MKLMLSTVKKINAAGIIDKWGEVCKYWLPSVTNRP